MFHGVTLKYLLTTTESVVVNIYINLSPVECPLPEAWRLCSQIVFLSIYSSFSYVIMPHMFSSQWCAEPLAFSVVIIFVYGIYNITDIAIDDVQACGPSYPEANPGGGGGDKGGNCPCPFFSILWY